MKIVTYVHHLHVDLTLNVETLTVSLLALVFLGFWEAHLTVVQNVPLVQNALLTKHVYAKNVLIHAQDHVG